MAVRLHPHQRPGRHDERRPRRPGPHRQEDGRQQRLPAEQASDLYITSGTTQDFSYGLYRIYSYTFELSNGDYLDDSRIASETGRNKDAVLYLAERAWCPLSVLGDVVRNARCGAFDDDLEVWRGWAVNPDGTDTATTGRFNRRTPSESSSGGNSWVASHPAPAPG